MKSLVLYGLILLGAFFAYKYYNNYYINKKVRDRIGWWLTEKPHNILDYLQNKCLKGTIDAQYMITEQSEQEIAHEIIKLYQEETKDIYIKEHYAVNRRFAKMDYSEYFAYFFERYLGKHDKPFFNGNRMYIEISREYFDDNHTSYDTKYKLTDYGVVYYKMYYMSRLFCEKSVYINERCDYHSAGLKEVIDTREVVFWTHQ